MLVCDRCKNELADQAEPDGARPFPAVTIAGGLAGTIAAAATGVFLLVPAALVVGAAADIRRCGVCGIELADDDPAHRAMEEFDDELGGRFYRAAPERARDPDSGSRRSAAPYRPDTSATEGLYRGPDHDLHDVDDVVDDLVDDRADDGRFVYDELEGVLVPEHRAMGSGSASQLELDIGVSQPPALDGLPGEAGLDDGPDATPASDPYHGDPYEEPLR